MPNELDAARLDTFAKQLRRSQRRWIDTTTLWSAFSTAFPTLAQSADRRQWFVAALKELADQQVIQLPRPQGSRWDRSLLPATPTAVYLLRPPAPPKNTHWKTYPWHARLRWVSELPRMTAELEEFLLRVHQGLVRGDFQARAPLKYRSLQLTGREKRLGELAQTTLFEDGRLDLELLGCFSETPPLAYESICDAPSIVIFENADAYSLARTVLRSLNTSRYGMIGFGGGNAISQSLPSLAMLNGPVHRIHYVGDLDVHGLRIAARASRAAARAGLPPVEPATELHLAMLASAHRFGYPDGWEDKATQRPSADKLNSLMSFLEPPVRETVGRILTARHRIPEEVLGPEELHTVWSSTIT
ncbi:MAG TPA: hypothetical protein VHV55_09735 [Pirellulales bacterium]|jgi:hypothetical protein|nr:hypothetical protein [Pirellulales bacterium]